MKFKDSHCSEFSIRLRTGAENFARKRFFADSRVAGFSSDWDGGEPLSLTHYTRDSRISDYHAHTDLRLRKGQVRIMIQWVAGTLRPSKDAEGPFAEEVGAWISRFLSKQNYPVAVIANYTFPKKTFSSSIPLPMPYMTYGTWKRPRTVVGMTISTDLKGAERATVHTEILGGESLWVMIYAHYQARPSTLTVERLLPRFDAVIRDFVVQR